MPDVEEVLPGNLAQSLEDQLARDAQGRVLSGTELGPTDSGVAIKALPLYGTRAELDQTRNLVQEAVKGLKTTGIQMKHAPWANAMTVSVRGSNVC